MHYGCFYLYSGLTSLILILWTVSFPYSILVLLWSLSLFPLYSLLPYLIQPSYPRILCYSSCPPFPRLLSPILSRTRTPTQYPIPVSVCVLFYCGGIKTCNDVSLLNFHYPSPSRCASFENAWSIESVDMSTSNQRQHVRIHNCKMKMNRNYGIHICKCLFNCVGDAFSRGGLSGVRVP